jgi:hypothetical protein
MIKHSWFWKEVEENTIYLMAEMRQTDYVSHSKLLLFCLCEILIPNLKSK